MTSGNGASRIGLRPLSKRQEHLADVSVGMLYMAVGGLDESHDLVLPHSWPNYTSIGGQPIRDTEAATESSYCHALVHR